MPRATKPGSRACARSSTLTERLCARRPSPDARRSNTVSERPTRTEADGGTRDVLRSASRLTIENYRLYRDKFAGTPFFPANPQDFVTSAEKVLPINHELIRRALKIPGLKIVFGADAVAGVHGRNAEDFIDRVRDCGVTPMAAMVSANSLGAKHWEWPIRSVRLRPV